MDKARQRYESLLATYRRIAEWKLFNKLVLLDDVDVLRIKTALSKIEDKAYQQLLAEDMLLASNLSMKKCGDFWNTRVKSAEVSPNMPTEVETFYRVEADVVGLLNALRMKVKSHQVAVDNIIVECANLRNHSLNQIMDAMIAVNTLQANRDEVVRKLERKLGA